jgi:hypothetical protein
MMGPANCYHFPSCRSAKGCDAGACQQPLTVCVCLFVCLFVVCLQVCHQPHEFQSIIWLFPLRTDGDILSFEQNFVFAQLVENEHVIFQMVAQSIIQDQSDPDFSLTC